ncbi:unnamed protein product (macronuclear) [Paramecium tetraurelia]|uniref:PAS domain-containing protein n=1 Tax=Paramecium tetraurelia TaxID=5888 RepID=A0DVA1_PARTE|nr:uncharacterized protein GSPATT00020632001 [Paramecium tetraurelia]CAK86968.1 unnamed protein product [Paramecium tetraurelia]|eukprot:XP_001454365.1 hypothetical protein (macronuclear) [Paramecium tetraurelia strain d4-2]
MWMLAITKWPTFNQAFIQYWFILIININLSLYVSFMLDTIFEYNNSKGYGLYHFIWILIMLFFTQLKISEVQMKSRLFQNIINEQTLLTKIQSFEQMISRRDKQSNIVLVLGIVRSHQNSNCKNNLIKQDLKRCYCTMKMIYDPKKQNDIRNLSSSITKHINIFSKLVIKSWYEQYINENQSNYSIRLQYSQYLFYKIDLYAQSLIELNKLNTQLKSFSDQLQFCNLSLKIKQKIDILCMQSYKQKFDFEVVVAIEESIKRIQKSIIYILDMQIKMFKSIIKYHDINEQLLIKDFDQTLNKIQEIKINWKDITRRQIIQNDKVQSKSFLNRKKEFAILYNWFRQNILKKRVKQSILPIEADEFIQEESDSDSENDHFYDQQKIFNLLSGIIHCNTNGEILKFSQNCQTLYGQQQLKSIFELIPHSMQRNHQIAMRQFIENGKRRSLFKKLKIFYINETSNIVQANKYLKCILNQKMSIEYVCMIRPIIKLTPTNFILLNENWEIDSTTIQIEKLFQKQSCLLIQCPKLLRYSHYQALMKDNDYDFFQLRISQNQKQYIQELTQYVQSQQNISVSHQTRRYTNRRGDNFKYLLDQALVDENVSNGYEFSKNNVKFRKIIDENNITLHIRIPLDEKQLNEDYSEFIRSLNQDDQMTKSMRIQRLRKIVIRNEYGLLRFNKYELLRRIMKYKLLSQKKYYHQIKKLFEEYCSNTNNLNKVLKIEGSILFTTQSSFDKTIIIKVNRFEFYEQEAKKYTSSSQSERKRTTSSQSTQFILRRNSDIYFQNFFQNQQNNIQTLPQDNDCDSIRDNITKTLITENELQVDFSNQKAISDDGFSKQNWLIKNEFIKDDLNKIPKMLEELTYIKLLNRFLLISLLILIITEYVFGPQLYISSIIQNSFNKVELVTSFVQIISKTYNSIIDLDLSLKDIHMANLTQISKLAQSSVSQLNELTLETQDFISIFTQNTDFNENISTLDLIGTFRANVNNFLQVTLNVDPITLNETISFYRTNLIPYFYVTLNKSMENINQALEANLEYIKGIFQAFLLFISLFNGTIIFSNIMFLFQMIKKIKLLLSSFSMINKQQFVLIYKYQISLRQQLRFLNITNLNGKIDFNDLATQNQIENLMQRENLEVEQDKDYSTTKYTESQHWIRLTIKVLLSYISIMTMLLIMGIYYNFYLQSIIDGISLFMQTNAFTQNLLPFWAVVAIKDAYCFQQRYQNEINLTQYLELINQFQSMQITKSVYNNNLQSVQSLFYGDQCQNGNLNLSSYETQQCQYLVNGALTKGLIVYYDYLYQISISLTNSSDTRFEKVSLERLMEFSEVSIKYIGQLQGILFSLQNFAVIEFNKEINSRLSDYIQVEKALVIVFISLTCLFYYLIIESYFHNMMDSQYRKFRQFYDQNYPNSILHQNKTLRARFKKYGILKK